MITKDSKVYTVCSMDHAGGLFAQTLPAVEIKAQVHVESFNPFGCEFKFILSSIDKRKLKSK